MNLSVKIILPALLLIFLMSCKKDHSVLGVDVQPVGDALNATTQSAPVFAYTLKYDSIISLNDRYKYLGSNQDPYFGRMDVGLYLNANIPDGKTFVNFGDDAQLTSSEIILAINGAGLSYAGSSSSPLSFSVFPMNNALDATKVYYTNSADLYIKNSVLGAYTGTLTGYEGKLVLRIPMDADFASAVLNNPNYLLDNTTFQTVYKGFYIKSDIVSGEGLIAEFDLEDPVSGFYLRYKNGDPSATKEEKSFRFTFSGTNINPIRFNTVKYDPSNGGNALLIQQVVNKDSIGGASNIFLKGLGATRAKVFIPSLKSLTDSFDVAVNRAEVIFHLDPAFALTNYPVPTKMCLFPIDSSGKETFALDQLNLTDRTRYDGSYDSDNKRYVFNIARHAQAVLSGKIKNNGFYLVVTNVDDLVTYKNFYNGTSTELLFAGRDHFAERVVLAGSNSTQLKPVFNLSYVKLKND